MAMETGSAGHGKGLATEVNVLPIDIHTVEPATAPRWPKHDAHHPATAAEVPAQTEPMQEEERISTEEVGTLTWRQIYTTDFVILLLVQCADKFGIRFLAAVNVPYGAYLGLDFDMIALANGLRFSMAICSTFLMTTAFLYLRGKTILAISMMGSAVGYCIQGLALNMYAHSGTTAVAVWYAGRAMTGLFGGTQPVLQVLTMRMSFPNTSLNRARQTVLELVEPITGGVFIIGGSLIALAGLNVPHYSSSAVSVLILICIVKFFKFEKRGGTETAEEQSENSSNESEGIFRHPLKDPVFLLSATSFTFAWIPMNAWPFLMPIVLMAPSFGIPEQNLPMMTGFAVGTIALTILAGAAVSKKVLLLLGKSPALLSSGCVIFASNALWGISRSFWHILVLAALHGICIGILLPTVMPEFTSYIQRVHSPRHHALALSMLTYAQNLAYVVSHNIVSALLGTTLHRVRFTCFITAAMFFYAVIMYVFFTKHARAAASAEAGTAGSKAAMETAV